MKKIKVSGEQMARMVLACLGLCEIVDIDINGTEKVNLAQTIAVGDGANDLPMISEAGLGIAFHAKPRVVANAKQSINTMGLDGVLYFLGFKDSYINY